MSCPLVGKSAVENSGAHVLGLIKIPGEMSLPDTLYVIGNVLAVLGVDLKVPQWLKISFLPGPEVSLLAALALMRSVQALLSKHLLDSPGRGSYTKLTIQPARTAMRPRLQRD